MSKERSRITGTLWEIIILDLEELMKNRYIFIYRDDNKEKDKKIFKFDAIHPVRKILKELFVNDSDGYRIVIDDMEYLFSFHKMKSSNTIYYFELSVDYTPQLNARILDEIHNKLTKGNHRKEYKIVVSYSGSSEYYCNKLYPFLNIFERRIRDMVFFIVTERYGVDWFIETTKNGLGEKIKSNKKVDKNKLVENALYEMTIGELEDYLFTKWRDINAEIFFDKEINISKINDFSKDELIERITSNELKSLWDRIFEGQINISDIREKISNVRNCRNIVAHSKLMNYDTFSNDKRLLQVFNKELEQACNLLVEDDSIHINLYAALEEFSNAFKDISKIHESALESMTRSLLNFSAETAKFVINDAFKSYEIMAKKLSEVYLEQFNFESKNE